VNVAWVTHHVFRDEFAGWALPGVVGGAELTDAAMLHRAPAGVDVEVIAPGEWESALDADRIVITGTDLLSDEAMTVLAARAPLVWVHHAQARSAARARLLDAASPLVCMSAAHAELEASWTATAPMVNHGWIDLTDIPTGRADRSGALWAARDHPQKGRIGARIWARANGYALTELTNAPRERVLDAMAAHEVFVFLPKGFDACPRTLIEAEAAGCRIVTNHLAGRREPGDLADVMAAQPGLFWEWL